MQTVSLKEDDGHLKDSHIRENPDIYALNLGPRRVKTGAG